MLRYIFVKGVPIESVARMVELCSRVARRLLKKKNVYVDVRGSVGMSMRG